MELVLERLRQNEWIPYPPTSKQLQFLAAPEREKFYGGAAGGGKSDALLMDQLLYADVPGFAGLILRRTFADLALPGAIMERAKGWLAGTDVRWSERDKTFHFPSGATLTFGYLEHENDKYRYQSAEFQKIGFDELTQFTETQYKYLRTRLRRLAGSGIPPSTDSASNPGGAGHEWVYDHFVVGGSRDRVFIPAMLEDNPHVDAEEYEHSFEDLDETTKAQLRRGLWVTDPLGKPFKREWWLGKNRYDPADISWANKAVARYVAFDTANKKEDHHAYTALCVGDILPDYRMVLRYVNQERKSFDELPDWITHQVEPWNYDWKLKNVAIEDAASGIQAVQVLQASGEPWIKPRIVPVKAIGKEESWAAASLWCARDSVLLPMPSDEAPWLSDFEAQIYNVPDTTFKDMADAFSLLINHVEETKRAFSTRWRAQRMLRTGRAEVA